MRIIKYISATALIIFSLSFVGTAQELRQRRASSQALNGRQRAELNLTGLYRIDVASSDTLYSVVADASSNLPFREQQRFFIDLAVRLTPPDQFSIEQRGRSISIASSRASRINFEADGVVHIEKTAGGHRVSTHAAISEGQLVVNTSGSGTDKFSVSFEPLENGRRLRVTRRIYAKELNQPVVIRSVYNKISEVAQWGIYGEPEVSPPRVTPPRQPILTAAKQPIFTAEGTRTAASGNAISERVGSNAAAVVSRFLREWVDATNRRDLNKLLSFYMPRVRAFYLARNVSREVVRKERARAFDRADLIEVHAQAPETILVEDGDVAIMRFRKKYLTKRGARIHRGEVIQELRWRRTDEGWKIFSERDVKVVR